ncbi:MAG TPA: hypothetical protein VIG62_16145 [Blastocatellia bacterium]|jgi:hypothetical protein
MRFTKPISREVDIDGNTFIVSFSDEGIDFRIKGKRRTARADWIGVLDIARGDQGESARDFLGVQQEQERGIQPNRAPLSSTAETFAGQEPGDTDQQLGRAVTASDQGRE